MCTSTLAKTSATDTHKHPWQSGPDTLVGLSLGARQIAVPKPRTAFKRAEEWRTIWANSFVECLSARGLGWYGFSLSTWFLKKKKRKKKKRKIPPILKSSIWNFTDFITVYWFKLMCRSWDGLKYPRCSTTIPDAKQLNLFCGIFRHFRERDD